MLELNIQDLREKALIRTPSKPEGHVFGVRRENPGDELKLSEIARKRNKLLLEAGNLHTEALKEDKDSDALAAKIEALTKKLDKLDDEALRVKSAVFDDYGDGSLSRELYLQLTDEERERLISAVEANVSIKSEPENGDAA